MLSLTTFDRPNPRKYNKEFLENSQIRLVRDDRDEAHFDRSLPLKIVKTSQILSNLKCFCNTEQNKHKSDLKWPWSLFRAKECPFFHLGCPSFALTNKQSKMYLKKLRIHISRVSEKNFEFILASPICCEEGPALRFPSKLSSKSSNFSGCTQLGYNCKLDSDSESLLESIFEVRFQ